MEARFTALIAEYDLPRAERNALIEMHGRCMEVGFLWRDSKLIVELDGYAAHGTRHAFEDDRERDRLLQLAGFRVVRITWQQLQRNPGGLARDIASLRAA